MKSIFLPHQFSLDVAFNYNVFLIVVNKNQHHQNFINIGSIITHLSKILMKSNPEKHIELVNKLESLLTQLVVQLSNLLPKKTKTLSISIS